jgi:hypothetical protein
MIVHKASTTLTAVLIRALTRAATTSATDVGHMAVGTHVEDDPAVIADATATPLVLLGGKRGSHVTVATGDVGALQVDTSGALMVAGTVTTSATGSHTSFLITAATVGTSESTYVTGTGSQRVRLYNNHASNVLYYRHATGVTTANGYPVPAGAQDEIDLAVGITLYLVASGASTDVRIREERR